MKSILTTILIIASIGMVYGQQYAYSSHFTETKVLWNPAATAPGSDIEAHGFFRKQWLGFEGSPFTGYANYAYPFVDYNMSAGITLFTDDAGPVSQNGVQLNYAYKLKGVIGDEGQLSFGISGSFSQLSYDGSNAIINDTGDPLVQSNKNSTSFPSVTAGFYYQNGGKGRFRNTNQFYVGASISQIYAGEVLVSDADFEREQHIHFLVGTKIYGYNSIIEPSLTVNYVNPEMIDVIVNARYELEEKFWAGLGYSSVRELALQGGFILPVNNYSMLRIGALGNYGITDNASDFGPGFEFMIGYSYDLE